MQSMQKCTFFFAKKIHKAQSLLSFFKEPQHNYLQATNLLYKGTTAKPTFVLLMDLMKAFEKIETRWILQVLVAVDSPAWFVSYTEWVLGKQRQSIAKIKGTFCQPLAITKGLDMGRACSVLLFCTAVDPFLTASDHRHSEWFARVCCKSETRVPTCAMSR